MVSNRFCKKEHVLSSWLCRSTRHSVFASGGLAGYAFLMIEIWVYGLLLVLGIGLIVFKPLSKAFKFSEYWEVGGGVLLILAFVFEMTSLFVLEPMIEHDLALKPCGEASPQGACYNLERALCDTAWATAEAECKEEATRILKQRPSALLGPLMNRCRAQKMDQALRYNRVGTQTPYCKAYFEYIERK